MESYVTYQEIKREWFTQIPNIVTRLLKDPYLYRVYAYLREVAGEEGHCTYSVKNMAETCGMSDRKFLECKKKLAQDFPEIGMPLIHIKQRFTPQGDRDTDTITILDIWQVNTYFKKHRKFPLSNDKVIVTDELVTINCNEPDAGGSECDAPPVVNDVHSNKRTFLRNIKKEIYKEKDPVGSTRAAKPPSNTSSISLDIEKREFVGITQEQLEEWKRMFPSVDVDSALTTCVNWHILNSKKRKNWLMTINKWLLRQYPNKKKDSSGKRDYGPNYEVNLKILAELRVQFPNEFRNVEVSSFDATLRDRSRNFDLSLQMVPELFEHYLIRKYCTPDE